MKKNTSLICLSLLMVFLSLAVHAQTVRNHTIELNISEIANPDLRYCLLANLAVDSNFDYTINEEENSVLLFSANHWDDMQFQAYFDETQSDILAEFENYLHADKETRGNYFSTWKTSLPNNLYVLLFKQMLIENPSYRDHDGNQTCATSDPFCTTDIVNFHVDANPGGSCEDGPYYGCLSSFTQRPPFWFHMKIGISGAFTIRMTNSANVDIDYCCWGPFSDPVTPCPSQLTEDKYVDCGSSADATENCDIPNNAQTGEYYILVITKYDQSSPTDITFQKVANSGPGETDCGILPPLVNNDGPFCVGETIHLTANAQSGAVYHWAGPNGFTSNQQNPTIDNCTLDMAGTYNCNITIGSQTSQTIGTEVEVYANPIANFTYTTVCQGEVTQFTSSSTTNPSNQPITDYLWDFGDGETSNEQSPIHQFSTAGSHRVSLTVGCGNGTCIDTKTQNVSVYDVPVANAGQDQTIAYGSTAQLQGSGGDGSTSYNYHWEPADKVVNADAQNTQTVALTSGQTYTLTVTNPEGQCIDSDEITISIEGSAMTAYASASPTSICQGDETQLLATATDGTGSFTYSWTPVQDLDNPHIANPSAHPAQTTNYSCHISDGQTTQDVSVTVVVNMHEFVETTQNNQCDEYIWYFGWNGESYPYHESGTFTRKINTYLGCDSTVVLHLQMDYSPVFDGIHGNHLVVGGSEFQYSIEQYSIHPNPKSTHNTDWGLYYPNGQEFKQWDIIPFGSKNDSCFIHIYTFERDSVELRAHTYSTGDCDCGEDTKSFWIYCGFYDTEEITAQPVSAAIYPNPNNGDMTLSFDNMTGDILVKVFNLTGQLMDAFMLNNHGGHQTHDYHATNLPKGVYFFNITSNEGTLTKRVILMK